MFYLRTIVLVTLLPACLVSADEAYLRSPDQVDRRRLGSFMWSSPWSSLLYAMHLCPGPLGPVCKKPEEMCAEFYARNPTGRPLPHWHCEDYGYVTVSDGSVSDGSDNSDRSDNTGMDEAYVAGDYVDEQGTDGAGGNSTGASSIFNPWMYIAAAAAVSMIVGAIVIRKRNANPQEGAPNDANLLDDGSIPASIDVPETASVQIMEGVEISDYVHMEGESPTAAASSSEPTKGARSGKKGFWRRPFGRMV